MANAPTLTDYEKKTLDEVEANMKRAFSEAQAKLEPLRAKLKDVEEGARCFRCDCQDYKRPRPEQPRQICAREGCHHGFTSHDFF